MTDRDRNRSYYDEREGRGWSRDESPSRDYPNWNTRERDFQRSPQSRYREDRDYYREDRLRGGYPGPFGWYQDPDVERDMEGGRSYRDYGGEERMRSEYAADERMRNMNMYGHPNQPYARQAQRDYQSERGDERGFGQQLKAAGQNIVRKVKRAFRGPKGYKRSDERIREDVNDRLSLQDQFDPTEIEVSVSNGEVTLAGFVSYRHEKFLAEEMADDVNGVSEVHNQLRVQREQSAQSTGTTDTSQSAGTAAATEAGRNRNARAY